MINHPRGLITYCTHCESNTLQLLNDDKTYICKDCSNYGEKEIIEKDLYIKELEKMYKNLQTYLSLTHTDKQILHIALDTDISQFTRLPETEDF